MRSRAFWFALVLAFAFWAVNALVVVAPVQNSLQTLWQQQGERLAEEYAQRAASLLARDDRIGLTVEVQRWSRAEDVAGVQILGVEERPIAQAGQQVTGRTLSLPIYFEETLLGRLDVRFDESVLRAAQLRLSLYLLVSALLLTGLGWLAWRFYFRQLTTAQARVANHLCEAFPGLEVSRRKDPLHQIADITQQLERHYDPSLRLLDHLQRRLSNPEFDALEASFARLDQPGEIRDAVLVRVQLLNLADLDSELDAPAIKRLLDRIQRRCADVLRLYNARATENPWQFLLAAYPNDPDLVTRALCASQVLLHLIQGEGQQARFSISVHAGPLYQGYQLNAGAPTRVVFGQATRELELLSLYNQGPQILVSDAVLQLEPLGNVIEASIYRDLTLPDAEHLEIWRLEGFAPRWQRVLERQVDALRAKASE